MPEAAGVVRVSLVEDDEDLAIILCEVLSRMSGVEFARHYNTAEKALRHLPLDPPDIVLVDLRLPGVGGVELIARLVGQLLTTSFVVLTSVHDDDVIFAALQAGATGYLLKGASMDEIKEAVRVAQAGGSPISPGIARKVVRHFQQAASPALSFASDTWTELSARERMVLESVANGLRDKEVAAMMEVSEHTVRTYVRRAFAKLQVTSRTEAVARLFQTRPQLGRLGGA